MEAEGLEPEPELFRSWIEAHCDAGDFEKSSYLQTVPSVCQAMRSSACQMRAIAQLSLCALAAAACSLHWCVAFLQAVAIGRSCLPVCFAMRACFRVCLTAFFLQCALQRTLFC